MPKKSHILVVDDDNRILKLLKQFLHKNGFLVSIASTANYAFKILDNFDLDLIILDIMMPEITGIEFTEKIKKQGLHLPIVMLTALSEPDDRVSGLSAGASDYITKPFEPRELLLRINNLINMQNLYKQEEKIIRFGNSYYNLQNNNFFKDNKLINLSAAEQKLLQILITANNKPLSRDAIASKMDGINARSVDVQIVRLRSKIEEDPKAPKFLKTIRNKGYVLYY